jgi:hypothetical protein
MPSEIVLFIMLFGAPVFIVYFYLRYKGKKLEALKQLVSSDKQVTPELIEAFYGSAGRAPMADLRLAVIYTAIGVATMIILGFESFNNPARLMLIGLLPLSIGLAYFVITAASLRGKA